MKKALYGVLLSALLAAGCLPDPFVRPDGGPSTDQKDFQADLQPARKYVEPVRADQVTAENAVEMADHLEAELAHEHDASK